MVTERTPEPDSSAAGDVTIWLRQLQEQDIDIKEEARRKLFQRYASVIQASIRNRIRSVQARNGASDIYGQIMESLFRGVESGKFQLNDREAIWGLLFTKVNYKVLNLLAFEGAQIRNFAQEQPFHSDEDGYGGELPPGAKKLQALEPVTRENRRNQLIHSPADTRGDSIFANRNVIELMTLGADQQEAANGAEVYDWSQEKLRGYAYLPIVFDMLLQQYTNNEIAAAISKTVRRVEQLIEQIRSLLEDFPAVAE